MTWRVPAVAAVLLALMGCADDGADEVRARLAGIERRLTTLEKRIVEAAAPEDGARGPEHAVADPTIHAGSASAAGIAPVARPSVPPPHPSHAPLADAYRRQVAEILERYADDPTAPEQLRELAEAKRAFYDALHELQVDSGQEVAPLGQ